MTKTCLQCGAVLPSSVRACSFCDSSFSTVSSDPSAVSVYESSSAAPSCFADPRIEDASLITSALAEDCDWRGELSHRVNAYRARRRKPAASAAQSRFPFDTALESSGPLVAVTEPSPSFPDDFSFTLAIGRDAAARDSGARMEIDVSVPAAPQAQNATAISPKHAPSETTGLYPVASLDERRFAAFLDLACLLFAYGGFLALFSSLGGQFTLSKLSAAVYTLSFAIVYLQYFALFTIFGGTTPGMIFRGLQVTSFTGDPPTPRQMLLRSLGYVLSAGTGFLGFFWAWWDEDALTWHDRLSGTYLSTQQSDLDLETSPVVSTQTR